VAVDLSADVSADFDSVTVEGFTTTSTTSTGPDLFPGINFVPASPRKYYNVSTTASFTGQVQVCITYNPADVQGSQNNLLLYHYDTSVNPPSWREITSSVNTTSHVVCGYSDGLSLFAVAEPGIPSAVQDGIPKEFRFFPSAPNPFRGASSVQFDLPKPGRVTLEVFDLQGRLVRSLLDGDYEPGRYSAVWQGRNQADQPVAPGIYFYRLRTPEKTAVQKVIKMS
jgi:hypothetical protein